MIRTAVPLKKLGIATTCREYIGVRDERSAELDGNTTFGPTLNAKVIPQYSRFGVGVLSDSLAFDGAKSWVVMSMGVDRYVTELSTECTQSVHPDAGAHVHEVSSTEQSVASIVQRTSLAYSSSKRRNENDIPIKLESGNMFPMWTLCQRSFKPITKRTIILLRQSHSLREEVGVTTWSARMLNFKRISSTDCQVDFR